MTNGGIDSTQLIRSFELVSDFGIRDSGGRRGRESNPRIEVLQTPTLPLGYPAAFGVNGGYEWGAMLSMSRRGAAAYQSLEF